MVDHEVTTHEHVHVDGEFLVVVLRGRLGVNGGGGLVAVKRANGRGANPPYGLTVENWVDRFGFSFIANVGDRVAVRLIIPGMVEQSTAPSELVDRDWLAAKWANVTDEPVDLELVAVLTDAHRAFTELNGGV